MVGILKSSNKYHCFNHQNHHSHRSIHFGFSSCVSFICCFSLNNISTLFTYSYYHPQEVLTRDSVTVAVDAVVYYRVNNATMSITNVEDSNRSTRLLAATTLRYAGLYILSKFFLYFFVSNHENRRPP